MTGMTMRTRRGAGGEVIHFPSPLTAAPAQAKAKRKRHVPDPIRTNGESSAEQLRLLIERAERIAKEQRGIAEDLRDLLAEAKSRGFDPGAIRRIMKIRLKERQVFEEEESILETYMHALGML